jgi:dTMP kinase
MIANKFPGKLIVLEGLDGSGQTTQAQLLVKWFADKRSQQAYYTKEPSDGPIGALLKLALSRRLIAPGDQREMRPLDPKTMALFFAADRADHLYNDVVPKLQGGIHVVGDRYYLSSLAYQSLELEDDWLTEINKHAIRPDLTVFLEVPPRVCVKRMQSQRWHVELYEDQSNLERVAERYRAEIGVLQALGEKIEVVDGNQPPAEVHRQVVNVVKEFLKTVSATENGKQPRIQTPKEQLDLMSTSPLTESEIATHSEG